MAIGKSKAKWLAEKQRRRIAGILNPSYFPQSRASRRKIPQKMEGIEKTPEDLAREARIRRLHEQRTNTREQVQKLREEEASKPISKETIDGIVRRMYPWQQNRRWRRHEEEE